MAEIYSYVTQAAFLTALASRLYDPNELQWSHAEKILYLQEALRTFNALTGFWRGEFTFQSQQGVVFYDITNQTTAPNTPRPLTLHDTDLYAIIQYHLLEPSVGVNPWTGVSTQFSASDLIGAVQRRRDELLSISGCTYTQRLVPAVAGRIQLLDSVIDIRRVAYIPNAAGQTASIVWEDDTWAEQAFNRAYPQQPAGTPFTYLQTTQPPIAFDTDRPPAFSGNYEILTIENGPALSPNPPSLLSVPDDWTHIIKWGALADLLSRDSNAKDIVRAQYCSQRYLLGSQLLTVAPALLALRLDNVPVQIDSVRQADLYRTTWEGLAQAQPDSAYTAGLNLLALAPPPNAGPYSLTASVVENAPLPSGDADFVQVPREDFDVLLDYATHLALFKTGGQEFLDTLPLFERFMKGAALYNSKLAELGELSTLLQRVSVREEDTSPRMQPQEATS